MDLEGSESVRFPKYHTRPAMNSFPKLKRACRELPVELRRFLGGRYPGFVTARNPRSLGQEVPVFMFHSVENEQFSSQLEFLARNGYQTLTLNSFLKFLRGECELDGPSVLLTFDDGHESWHRTAFPLLRKHGFHAVGFLVPNFVREKSDGTPWLTWDQVREIEQSGTMTFESHTANHDKTFVTPDLVDFFHPSFETNPLGLDTPWIHDGGEYTNKLKPGTPVYGNSPRLAGKLRFIDNPEVRKGCTDFVTNQGTTGFFQTPHWRKRLLVHWRMLVEKNPETSFETTRDQKKAILEGLVTSRELLAEKLSRAVTHLCLPWGTGSKLAVELSQEAGYESVFWVTNDQQNINRCGTSPFGITRLKDDFITRLPGKGRSALHEVFFRKLRRRADKIDIY